MRASHVYHAVRQQLFDFYIFPHRNSILFLSSFQSKFSVKNEVKNSPKSDKKRHFSSGVLFIATMGSIGTPKVDQKGTILRLLASQKGAKGPLGRSKGAKTSHCEGPGRLKWSPKAHFDVFWVPRCPKKLHIYHTNAPNWPQGFHFEGFGLDFAYSHVFFECVCVTCLLLQFSFFLVLRCGRCSHPAQASLAKPRRNKHHQQKTPAEPASKPEASIISKNKWHETSRNSPTSRDSITNRLNTTSTRRHHLQKLPDNIGIRITNRGHQSSRELAAS